MTGNNGLDTPYGILNRQRHAGVNSRSSSLGQPSYGHAGSLTAANRSIRHGVAAVKEPHRNRQYGRTSGYSYCTARPHRHHNGTPAAPGADVIAYGLAAHGGLD